MFLRIFQISKISLISLIFWNFFLKTKDQDLIEPLTLWPFCLSIQAIAKAYSTKPRNTNPMQMSIHMLIETTYAVCMFEVM